MDFISSDEIDDMRRELLMGGYMWSYFESSLDGSFVYCWDQVGCCQAKFRIILDETTITLEEV